MRNLGYAMESGAACYLFRRWTGRKVTESNAFLTHQEALRHLATSFEQSQLHQYCQFDNTDEDK